MANLLARGVEWAGTAKVTIQPLQRGFSEQKSGKVRMLVVTGGHSYPVSFFRMLDRLEGVAWTHWGDHAEAFSGRLEDRFDLVLLHDMHETTTEQTRTRLKAFVDAGKGILSVHHAVVDYTDWPWWYEEVTGGKYFVTPVEGHPASRYHEDVEFLVTPVKGKESHPVLRGLGPLWVYDELYKGMFHSPRIDVLMETSHPENDRPVVYLGPHPQARVVYIQLGHSDDTMNNPGFRRLVWNAVNWVARRTN